MYRRYTLDEVKRRIVDILQNVSTGLTGVELADKTGLNRMTVTKYLDILYAMGLVKKKKTGSVNVWFLETGIADIEFPVNYLQIQQKLLKSVLAGEEDQARRVLVSVVNSEVDQLKVLVDVILPTVNTINELYSRGRLDKTERTHLLDTMLELIDIVKFNARPTEIKANAHVICVAGSGDRSYAAKCASIAFRVNGWNSLYVGNVEEHIDPFFDIDFQRYVAKLWAGKKGLMVICLFSSGEGSLKFLISTTTAMKGKMKGEVRIAVNTSAELEKTADDAGADFVAKDVQSLVEGLEREYKKVKW